MPTLTHTTTAGASQRIAVIGAGWAGLAAAIGVTQSGHYATVFEASKAIGGRARALEVTLPDGRKTTLDNGQHILIGAYADTLRLMQLVGVERSRVLLDLPMSLRFPDGKGIVFPRLPAPLDALTAIVMARGWSLGDKLNLLRVASGWQRGGFQCAAHLTVTELCQSLGRRVTTELMEPLCVSALNTPAHQASASVFMRVLRDALFGASGGSHLLLPLVDMSALFPDPAATWLVQRGASLRLSTRVGNIVQQGTTWQVEGETFDGVILATSASHAALALKESCLSATQEVANNIQQWATIANGLQFEPITTVYAWAGKACLTAPMLALRSDVACPAQFVFDRGQLGGPAGLLAFVVSASVGDHDTLTQQVLRQAKAQLGLSLQVVQTVVEKRATFACTAGLRRPPTDIAPGLWACGDYVQGPYPATLEGAVRSGLAAAGSAIAPARQGEHNNTDLG